jgi:hypothetical protein
MPKIFLMAALIAESSFAGGFGGGGTPPAKESLGLEMARFIGTIQMTTLPGTIPVSVLQPELTPEEQERSGGNGGGGTPPAVESPENGQDQ